jgi:hypothetical protein
MKREDEELKLIEYVRSMVQQPWVDTTFVENVPRKGREIWREFGNGECFPTCTAIGDKYRLAYTGQCKRDSPNSILCRRLSLNYDDINILK